jgi:predicted nucleic acid-binding protein
MPAAKAFIDTNVLLYLLSADAAKADRAESTVRAGGRISVQVLNEIANVARRKLAMPWAQLDEVLSLIRSLCSVEPLTVEMHERGRLVAQRYGLSVYDAMIRSPHRCRRHLEPAHRGRRCLESATGWPH